jgi:hypothetical protein
MQKYYLCPECRGHLKVGKHIVFTAKNSKGEKGLKLLHPEIGNYSSIKHPSFQYARGEPLDFGCPLCGTSFQSKIDKNLVHVLMIDKDKKEYDIFFSRIAGEQSTFSVSAHGDSVMQAGEDSHKYTYFKIPEKVRRFLKT